MARVRRAEHSDVGKMVAFGREFWHQTSYYQQGVEYDEEQCSALTHHLIDEGIVLLAESNNRPVALLLMVVGAMPFNPLAVVATELVYYVDPEHRKGGLGFKILKQAEKLAESKGVKYISMIHMDSVTPERAEAVYKRMGYHKTETLFSKELK